VTFVGAAEVGILGGGQLGRLLALAAHGLGLRPLVLDPDPECAASAVAPTIRADYRDADALARLGRCSVVTCGLAAVPPAAIRTLSEFVPVRPGPDALARTRDRWLERRLLERLDIPTPRCRAVDSEQDLLAAATALGWPSVLKPRSLGHAERGHRLLGSEQDLAGGWRELGGQPLVLEEFVAFDREVSIVAVRSMSGEVRFWAPTENRHVDGVLRIARAPAPHLDEDALALAQKRVATLLTALEHVGVLAVGFFVEGRKWIANQVACGVHDSGNWTLGGAATSQFENHLRAIAGLPLGSTRCVEPSAMVNLIGGLPSPETVLSVPWARLHVYGEAPAPGRKLGHITVSAPTFSEAEGELGTLVQRLDDPSLLQALEPVGPPC
jgi:5-(carboxyamino)imidazole ribonucleotide synthase